MMLRFAILLVAAVGALIGASSATASGAYTFTDVASYPIEATFSGDCLGESVSFAGDAQIVYHGTIDPTGKEHTTTYTLHLNLVGTGDVTGTTYRYVEANGSFQTTDLLGDYWPAIGTFSQTMHVISAGGGADLLGQFKSHLTALDESNWPVYFLRIELTCVG
jgi:hypothetical protein